MPTPASVAILVAATSFAIVLPSVAIYGLLAYRLEQELEQASSVGERAVTWEGDAAHLATVSGDGEDHRPVAGTPEASPSDGWTGAGPAEDAGDDQPGLPVAGGRRRGREERSQD